MLTPRRVYHRYFFIVLAVALALFVWSSVARADVGTQVDYVARTTNASVGTSLSDYIVGGSHTYDGSTRVRVELYIPNVEMITGQDCLILLYEGSTQLGRLGDPSAQSGAGGTFAVSFYGAYFLTPSAGAHAYKAVAQCGTGTATFAAGPGGSNQYLPAWLRVSDDSTVATSGASSVALHDLTDVNDAGKSDGSVLKYNGATSKWAVGTDSVGSGGTTGGISDDVFRAGMWLLLGAIAAVFPAYGLSRLVLGWSS
jgi:hypothetical protein